MCSELYQCVCDGELSHQQRLEAELYALEAMARFSENPILSNIRDRRYEALKDELARITASKDPVH